MPFVEANGVRINYALIPCESGDYGEDLVMVHGLATNLAFWYFGHAPEFSKRYRVTLYDLRGHGRSSITKSGYTAGNLALDLQHFLDRLGIERAHFVAHSFGGSVALNLACRNPGRFVSLVLADTHISEVREHQRTPWKFGETIKGILERNGLNLDVNDPYFGYRLLSEVARLQLLGVKISPKLEDLVKPFNGNNSKRTAGQWLKLLETTSAEKELMSDDGLSLAGLRKLGFPILAVYGESSQAMPTGKQLLDVWPHADFRRIRGAGHFFPVTRPSEFVKTCTQFWNGTLLHGVARRKEDADKRYFRSSRFYPREGAWFFDTRESLKNGPFNGIEEAKQTAVNISLAGQIGPFTQEDYLT